MRSAYGKDIARTIRGNLKRFVAIVVITVLGVCMFSGLKASCDDLRLSADEFFDAQQLFDVRVLSTLGLTDDDVAALADVEGVAAAEGGYAETVYTDAAGNRASADMKALSPDGMNSPYVLDGALPAAAGEVAVTSQYLADTGKQIGDTLEIEPADDEDEAVFERRAYRITGAVIDPMETNNPDGSMSFRSSTSSDYSFFVTDADVQSDVYTAVYLRIDGADALRCYGQDYENAVAAVVDRIGAISAEREQVRTDAVRADAEAQVADAETEAQEGFADAEDAFVEGQAEIDDGYRELEDGQAELDANRQTIKDGQAEIDANRAQLAANKQQVADGLAQLEDAQAEADANRQTLADTRAMLEEQQAAIDALPAQREQLEAGKAQLAAAKEQAKSEYAAAKAQLEQSIAALRDQIAALPEDDPDYADRLAELQAKLEQAQGALETCETTYQQAMGQLAQQEEKLAEQDALLTAAEEQAAAGADALKSAWAQLEAGEQALAAGQSEIDANRAQLEAAGQQIADGEAQLESAQQELDSGRAQLAAGQDEIDAGRAQLEDGQAELDGQRADYEEQKADALAEIADARAEIDDIEQARWYIQDRMSLSGYSSIASDADSIEALGTAFPVIFLVVAILVSLTAITRMVEEERSLVGTYKALGYNRARIYAKYLVYALLACAAGGIVGNLCGFVALPAFIFTVFDVMYVLPFYHMQFDPVMAMGGFALFAVAVGGATFVVCRGEVRQTPAALMRPKAPKFGSRIFLEHIGPLWRRLSFLNKVTARNLFRYKKRFFMTVVGIAGCTALVVCGFVIKDAVAAMAPEQYGAIDRYDIMAVTDGTDFASAEEKLAGDARVGAMQSVLVDSGEVANGEGSVDVQIIAVPEGESLDGYVSLMRAPSTSGALGGALSALGGVGSLNSGGEEVGLPAEGMLVTRNAADVLGLSDGASVQLQDSALDVGELTVAGVVQGYLGNYAYLTQQAYEQAFGSFEPNAVLVDVADGVDAQALADELAEDGGFVSVVSTAEMRDSFASSFALINSVVAIIIVMAAALAFVVLFTLSTTNISERERELATIKVLGFRRREVHRYVNKETLVLTVIGIAVGLVAGPPLGGLLLGSLNMPGIAFPVYVTWLSMGISAVLPFVFALAVNRITNRSLDRIDMIGALKSVE